MLLTLLQFFATKFLFLALHLESGTFHRSFTPELADKLAALYGIPGAQGAEGGSLLPGCERTRKTAAFQMERQKQKFCGEKLQ